MEAILVLKKIPRDCDSCPLLDGNRYCAALQKYAFLNEWVSDAPYYSLKEKGDCPLKPLPKKEEGIGKEPLNIEDALNEGYVSGWNDCLDAILGETE